MLARKISSSPVTAFRVSIIVHRHSLSAPPPINASRSGGNAILRTTVAIVQTNLPIARLSPVCLGNSSAATATAFTRHCSAMANRIVAMALMKSNARPTPASVPSSNAVATERCPIGASTRISDVTIRQIARWVKTKKTAHR